MSQHNDTGFLGRLRAGEPIPMYARVTVDGEAVEVAGASDRSIGTNRHAIFEEGEGVTVILKNKPGTQQMIAAGPIAAGVDVFGAASGKIAASGTIFEGIALQEATADGDVIEVLPGPVLAS